MGTVDVNRDDDPAAKGRQIVESGKYAPPRGEYLGRIELWGLDVFAGSPQLWIDTLLTEMEAVDGR